MTNAATKAPISDYDQWTINYLSGVGVKPVLLERVTRLAQEVADLTAEMMVNQRRRVIARSAVRKVLEDNGTISSEKFVDAVLDLLNGDDS